MVRAQYERLRPEERRQFRRVLRAAARLDRQLGELHLVLPVLEVRFLGLARSEELTLQPSELLEELKYWD